MNEKNHTYERRITDLERDNIRLDQERARLVNDPVYFEKVARERMGIIKGDEVIYKLVNRGEMKDGPNTEEASSIIIKPADDKDSKDNSDEKLKPVGKTLVKKDIKPVLKKDSKLVKKDKIALKVVEKNKTEPKKSDKLSIKPKKPIIALADVSDKKKVSKPPVKKSNVKPVVNKSVKTLKTKIIEDSLND